MGQNTDQAKPTRTLAVRLWLVPIVGVALSIASGFLAWRAVQAHDEAIFQRQAAAYLAAFQQRRNNTEDLLLNLRSLFHVKPDLTLEAFHEAITGLVIRLQDVQALGWAPVILGDQRAALEAEARRRVSPGFEVREGDPALTLVTAKPRDHYYPLLFLDQVEGNEHLLGLDLAVGDVGASFETARKDGQVLLTPRVRVKFRDGVAEGLVAAMAVYRPMMRPPTDEERDRQATGFVATFIVINDALARMAERVPDFGLDVLLKDTTPDRWSGVLGVYTKRGPDAAARLRDEAAFTREPHSEQPVEIGGRKWVILFRRGESWKETEGPIYPVATLCCGLLLTLILTQHLWASSKRTEEVERLVVKRTAELSAAKDRLQQESQERLEMARKLQETQKLESLGLLAGGIAHDFNNLLTTMLGNASLARMDLPPGSPASGPLLQIEEAALRAADLCKQMLAYAGKGRFVVETIDLRRLVLETTELLRLTISKKAALRFDLDAHLPAVMGDATQLRQVLMNLVMNASEAIGERPGTIVVRATVGSMDSSGLAGAVTEVPATGAACVVLEVTDDGCGMDANTKARIFDPFFTTKFTGRGLGLAAVLGIARSHQGALLVDSEPGKGSTFRLLLPATPGQELLGETAQPAPETPWHGSGLLLVVDDEDQVRSLTARCLVRQGFEVETARNGREAIQRFQTSPRAFSAVLLDLLMPGMDGVETFHELRAIRPDVRVLLMSGYSEQDASGRFPKEAPAAFLQKPFRPEELQRALRGVLEKGG